MLNANAILYILPYDKEVGEDTCGSLYVLRNNYSDFIRKLFIVNNRSFCDHKKFFQANLETIKEMFGPSMTLYRTDAHLAYLGEIKRAFDKGSLSSEEIDRFILSCQFEAEEDEDILSFNGFIEAWKHCINAYTTRYRWSEMPSAEDVLDKSKITDLLEDLLKFIEQNRAYSIIASDGLFKLYNELKTIRKSLILRYIQPHLSGREHVESIWDNRISKSNGFEEAANNVVQKHLFESINNQAPLCDRLAAIVYSQIFSEDSIDRLIISICREIYCDKQELAKCGKDERKIKAFISPKLEKVISDFIVDSVAFWNNLIQQGQAISFSETFINQALLIDKELDLKWKECFANSKDGFDTAREIYFVVPKDTTSFVIGSSHASAQGLTTGSVPLMGALLNEIAISVASIVATILVFILPTLLALIGNPIGWTIAGVAAIFGAGYYAITGDDWMENKFINNNAPKIKEKMTEQDLESKLKAFIHKEIVNLLQSYSQQLCINRLRMEDERDIALSTPQEELERKCFASVNEIIDIDECISKYAHFCDLYLDYGKK